jgi:hypothetical protein
MVQLFFMPQYASVLIDIGNHMKTLTTTEQALSFIQSKIAQAHAAGDDIMALLTSPEILFSLEVLECGDNSMVLAPVIINIDEQKVQIFTMVAAKANNSSPIADLHF